MPADGRWFGAPERPLMGWLTLPDGGAAASGVLMLPPVGYQWWSAHRTLRTVAERLGAAAHAVLRIDYDGTGDSSGDQWDGDRVEAWHASVRHGADELRALGCTRLTLVGARLGGAFALLDAAAVGADAVVAWSPVSNGRRYAKEVKLLSTPVPEASAPEGTVVSAGTVFSAATLADLGGIKLASLTERPARRVALVDGPGAGDAKLAEALRALGCAVDAREVEGGESALESPTEYATVPGAVVEALVEAVGPVDATGAGRIPEPRTAAELHWRGTPIAEEVVRLGPHELTGVLSAPAGGPDLARPVLVFLNTGSEPHVGPGRAWVEYARELATAGFASVRTDFRGWGESPDDGHAPGRPYDAHCVEDVADITAALRERGHRCVVVTGLCAGAWVALQAVLDTQLDGVIALNPQLYWRPGDPVEALMSETRERRAPIRLREERGCRLGVWSALDAVGMRPWAGKWLDRLEKRGTRVHMLFADGDDGIEYLRNRLGRRFERVRRAGTITVAEVPEIDHSMHRAWLRPAVTAALRAELESLGDGRMS